MPQLDPSSYPSQLFWLTVTFLFLYLMLARFIVPRIGGILEGRRSRIEGDLADAARFRDEAEAARTAYEKELHDTRARAQALIAEAQAKAGAEASERLSALDRDMARRISEAQQHVELARERALQQMEPAVAALTEQIVEKVAHYKPAPQQIDAAIGALIGKVG
jgi:F-type H+-transporting ATPase subunit b